jgi:hypothetical protein
MCKNFLDQNGVGSNHVAMTSSFHLFGKFLLSLGLLVITLPATAQTNSAPAPKAPAPVAAPAAAAQALDLGDGSSSAITTKAWQALDGKDYAAVAGYTGKCIEMFKDKAVEMQASLKAPAPKDQVFNYWALNDVGTCYFIQGKALDDQGDKKGAIAAYKFLVDNLSYAQCWDTKGWFWSPADAARKRLAELQFDAQ